MPSVTTTAINNSCLKAAANLTAQLAAGWHAPTSQPLDLQRIAEFAVFGFVGAQIGYRWQHLLEDLFPTRRSNVLPRVPPSPGEEKTNDPPGAAGDQSQSESEPGIDWRNVAMKLVADQTVGLLMMIIIFLIITNAARLRSVPLVMEAIQQKAFKLVKAGWTIWPAVAICQFLWVPVRWRMIVAGCIGFGWNIFLSIASMSPPPSAQLVKGQ